LFLEVEEVSRPTGSNEISVTDFRELRREAGLSLLSIEKNPEKMQKKLRNFFLEM
jgi:hypothetical protein